MCYKLNHCFLIINRPVYSVQYYENTMLMFQVHNVLDLVLRKYVHILLGIENLLMCHFKNYAKPKVVIVCNT